MTNVKPATDERVERWRAVLNHRPCSDPNACDWCQLLARIDADREEMAFLKPRVERDMCADGHERIRYTPDEEFGPCPVCVLRAENSTQGRLLALKEGELAALKAEVETVRGCLHELAATVRGEAPSLLNEDSGGDAFLSMRIDEALGTGRAR